MAGQLCGGILAAIFGLMVHEGSMSISPRVDLEFVQEEGGIKGKFELSYSSLNSYISEAIGSFVFILLFMLATEKDKHFSEDKVINCLILASAYVGARLLAGG